MALVREAALRPLLGPNGSNGVMAAPPLPHAAQSLDTAGLCLSGSMAPSETATGYITYISDLGFEGEFSK